MESNHNKMTREKIADQMVALSGLLLELADHFDHEGAIACETGEVERWREKRTTVVNAARALRLAAMEVRP